MFNHILIPLDGSKLSETSLEPAAYLAKKLHSSVILLHVIEEDAPAEVHKERHLTKPDEAETYLKDAAQRYFPTDIKVETHVHTAPVSDVARSIVEHMDREFQPDLIIACTHGHSDLRDRLFGSIAQQIVSLGSIPLLLVKPENPPFKLDKALIPLDPASIHDFSLPIAEELARNFNTELHLLSVIPTLSTLAREQAATGTILPITTQALLDNDEEHARYDLQAHLNAYHQAGLQVSAEVTRGDPVAMILKKAEKTGADLVIMSTHRKAGMDAFWSGSVAPKVAQQIKTPLLLIPLINRQS